ncbi:MAG: gfo/Idh/MocA family oxidoreductase [Phycisphaera sp.]|nr:gfo/Idh/MocA family oxidoreductase [Phycisphaera sp.]
MANRTTRRTFIKHIGYAGAALPILMPPLVRGAAPSGTLRIAGIGVGGKGWGDITETSKSNAKVIAVCDVDERGRGRQAFEKFGSQGAATFNDWRQLLDKVHNDIDACTVSTPDHMHAPIAVSCMSLGKHVYVQKPLAHDVYEARQMRLIAAKNKVVTQMGNQGHSATGNKMLVQIIQSGTLGKIKVAHAWSNRPIWPQGIDRPAGSDPVPEGFDWDLWLGTAPERPFVGKTDKNGGVDSPYCPFKWRGFWDFGTGAQGDMACHIMDPVVWSLALGAPTQVWSEGPKPNSESYPKWSTIAYDFPGTQYTDGPIRLTWYDGGKMPDRPEGLPADRKMPDNGTLFIGEKGFMLTPHGSGPRLYPEADFGPEAYPKVVGDDHYMQWTNACLGNDKTTSHFDYAGPLTETVLLGNIALRFPGEKLAWNPEQLTFTNKPEANQYVRRTYRKGWEVDGLS